MTAIDGMARSTARSGDLATGDTATAPLDWDVRVVRLMDDSVGRVLLERLLAVAVGAEVLAQPSVTRIAPMVSVPWIGALRVTRAPVRLRDGRTSAIGRIEMIDVGAGTTEVRLCLRSTSRWGRLRGWRHLIELADDAGDRLVQEA